MENKREAGRTQLAARTGRAVILLLCIALVVILVIISCRDYVRRQNARIMLSQAKSIELAFISVASERRAAGLAIVDSYSEHGLAEGVYESICSVSGCTGELDLISWDEKLALPARMIYTEGDLCAVFDRENGGKWSVYRHDGIITIDG